VLRNLGIDKDMEQARLEEVRARADGWCSVVEARFWS
jgi:hypothetical protein